MLGLFAVELLTTLWLDQTPATIGETAEWSNKVLVADVDDDGDLDVVFANGGNYASAGAPEPNRVFLGDGAGAFVEATGAIFGPTADSARVVESRDFDGDGHSDLLVGTTWQTQSRLFRGLGAGAFEEVTASALPQLLLSVGDVAAGDVDGDGDLDLLLADWGAGSPTANAGGRAHLWLNDGGVFTDATEARMPTQLIRFSWEAELADVDNDGDLDALISCKSCKRSRLYTNDGTGTFTDVAGLPAASNNYDFEVMDVTGDGYVDLVTINDGPGLTNTLLVNDGAGAFADESAARWSDNVGEDDNMAVFLDVDSDGDADLLIGSLSGDDRLYVNEGGYLSQAADVFEGPETPGTLGIAVGDLNGDHRLDVVQAQGEVAFDDRVFLATEALAPDTAAPTVQVLAAQPLPGSPPLYRVVARIHDRQTPTRDVDFSALTLTATPEGGAAGAPVALRWAGEALFAAVIPLTPGSWSLSACATDRAGNSACGAAWALVVEDAPPPVDPGPEAPDAGEADAVSPDAGEADAVGPDAEAEDTVEPDAQGWDAGEGDATSGGSDTVSPDTVSPDAGDAEGAEASGDADTAPAPSAASEGGCAAGGEGSRGWQGLVLAVTAWGAGRRRRTRRA